MKPVLDICHDDNCDHVATHEVIDTEGKLLGRFCRPCARLLVADMNSRIELPETKTS